MDMHHLPHSDPEQLAPKELGLAHGTESSPAAASRIARVAEGIPQGIILSVIDRYANGGGLIDDIDDPALAGGDAPEVTDDAQTDENGRVKLAFLRLQQEIEVAAQQGPARVDRERQEFMDGLMAETGTYRRTYEMERIEYDQALDEVIEICLQDGREVEKDHSLPRLQTLRLGFVQDPSQTGRHAVSDFAPVVAHVVVRMLQEPTNSYPAITPRRVLLPGESPRYIVGIYRRDMPATPTDEPEEELRKKGFASVRMGGELSHQYGYSYKRYEQREIDPLPRFDSIVKRSVEAEVGVSLCDMEKWGLGAVKAAFPNPSEPGQKVEFLGAYNEDYVSREALDDARALLRGLYEGGDQPTDKALHLFARSPEETATLMAIAKRMCEGRGRGLHESSLDARHVLQARLAWLEANAPVLHRAAVDVMRNDYVKIYSRIENELLKVHHVTQEAKRFVLDIWKDAPLRIVKGEPKAS